MRRNSFIATAFSIPDLWGLGCIVVLVVIFLFGHWIGSRQTGVEFLAATLSQGVRQPTSFVGLLFPLCILFGAWVALVGVLEPPLTGVNYRVPIGGLIALIPYYILFVQTRVPIDRIDTTAFWVVFGSAVGLIIQFGLQFLFPRNVSLSIPSYVVFLAPAVILYTMFMIYPLIDSLRLGFYSAKDAGAEGFVGLNNYQTLVGDPLWSPRLWGAIKNNLIFFAIHMCVQNPVGLLLAALLSSHIVRGRALFRTLIFTPTVLSVVLVGFIWRLILSPLWGKELFGGKMTPLLGLPETALATLGLVSVWQNVGIPMMLFLAALISIPDELIEAARVDGASAWEVFWRVKFRLILPTVGIIGILTFVGNFNAFDLVYTTQTALAGPDFSTDLLATFFYRTFFGFQLQLGNPTMGAAVAGVMFLIILAGVIVYMVGWQRRLLKLEIEL